MWRFSQFNAAPQVPDTGTLYRALEGEGAYGLLGPDRPPPPGALASYQCERLGDTGPATEAHGVLMIVAFNAPAERIPELERWYEEEHIRMLTKAGGWLRAINCRVRAQVGAPVWTHIAFHELRDRSVMDSPERAAARSTPWRAELAAEPWFAAAGRWVYGRI